MRIFGKMTKQTNSCRQKDDKYEETQYYQKSIGNDIFYEYVTLVAQLLQALIQYIHSSIFSVFNNQIDTTWQIVSESFDNVKDIFFSFVFHLKKDF